MDTAAKQASPPDEGPDQPRGDNVSQLLDPWRVYLKAAAGPCPWREGQFGLLDAAEAWLLRRPQLSTGRQLPLSLEASANLTPAGLEARRYIVGIPLVVLGRNPLDDLEDWLRAGRVPPGPSAALAGMVRGGEVPSAVQLGLAWADDPRRVARRVYVERRPLSALLGGGPGLAMVGAEWSAGAEPSWRHYVEVQPSLRVRGADRVASRALQALVGESLEYVWDRQDRGSPAWDRYWHLSPQPLAHLAPRLADLAKLLVGQGMAARAWLEGLSPGAHLRVIGWGQDASGQPRLKLYHTPGPLPGTPAPPPQHEALLSEPSAVLIEVRRGNHLGWLVFLPGRDDPPTKPARRGRGLLGWNLGAAELGDLDAVLGAVAGDRMPAAATPVEALGRDWLKVGTVLEGRGCVVLGLRTGPPAD